jgi:predicted branched-subunit amino acid permease
MWTLPPPVAAMMVACAAANARYLVMGAHLRRHFGALRRSVMLPLLFLVADASWLMTTADAERNGPDAGYLLGSSIPMAIGWIGGTALGYELPLQPGGPLAVAAALLPVAFVVTLLPTRWHGWRTLVPWATAAVIALLVARFIGPSWAMLAGGSAGTLVGMTRGDDA